MDRPVFGKKSSRSQRLRVDRFIPSREVLDQRRRRSNTFDADETRKIWDGNYQKQKKYKNYLDEVFGMEPKKVDTHRNLQPWPCAPRSKGYLSSADSILDLPNYSYALYPDILDWSNTNMLVAALGYTYHMYNWEKQNVTGYGVTHYPIQCCKFDPTGDILTIGTESESVEVHDSSSNKLLHVYSCECRISDCTITAIDWSPTGNSFITGCSKGYVVAYDYRKQNLMSWQCLSHDADAVMTVRISPDTRFVATVILNSPTIKFLTWPFLEICFSLSSSGFVKSISWHPWRSALLGLGVMTANGQTSIALCETPSSRVREFKLGIYNKYSLDMMLFSHRTGELVLSLWKSVTHSKTSSQLMVMSDPYTVVDQSGDCKLGLDRVRTMVFSPDGTKVATATADEDLIIWNYLPEDKTKKNTRPRRFSALPVYMDEVTFGYVLR